MTDPHDGPDGPPEDSTDDAPDEVGSVAEEAVKLFGALSDWARHQPDDLGVGVSGLADHAARAARGARDHLHPHVGDEPGDAACDAAPECSWCPLCRAVHAVRRTSPEVRTHLVGAASALLQAASAALATQVPPQRSRPAGGVETIDLDAEPGPEPGDQPGPSGEEER